MAFGPDSFFGDHMGFYRALSHSNPWPVPEHEPVEWVAGMENPGEAIRNAAAWLVGGNALRVLAAVQDNERN
ncbi:MAG TPA: hypothetical protein VG164_11815 [Trebonia sp.]|nr:hypothetical protein [Trebonia sp.]